MIFPEKIKAIATANVALSAAIGARMFQSEAPEKVTLPCVVFMVHEEAIETHNTGLQATRPWKLYLYACGATPLQAHQLAVLIKNAFVLYKESEPGASDTDIQSITIDTGIVDLERTATTKEYPCSLILDVWEQIA